MLFANAPSRARRVVRQGDILISTVRTYLKAIAPVKNPSDNFIASTGFAVIRSGPRSISNYLAFVLCAEGFIGEVISCSVGISYPAINATDLVNIHIPLPPLSEQTQIAKFLDYETGKIDALIEKQQQLVALLKEKRQAVISHAVTKGLNPDAPMRDSGIEWLGKVPAHWEIRHIRHITDQLGGGTPSKDNPTFWDGNIPWVSPKDMKVDYISDSQDSVTKAAIMYSAAKLIPVGSVLIVVRGMILDHSVPTAFTTKTVTINQDMKALVPSQNLDGEFLLWVLKGLRDYLLSHTDSSAHGTKCLATERLERTSITIPCLNEQRELVRGLKEKLSRIDSLRESAASVSMLLQERRTALISAAVTGKIDVRGWQLPQPKLATEAT
ncbi:MAG: restriction endonuclease subunit S [Candidatus Promineifilaceae bacterium]